MAIAFIGLAMIDSVVEFLGGMISTDSAQSGAIGLKFELLRCQLLWVTA